MAERWTISKSSGRCGDLELVDRFEDVQSLFGRRAAVLDVADSEVAAPAGRFAFGIDHRVLGSVLVIEHELALLAAIGAIDMDGVGRRVHPFAEEDAHEADLPACANADADDDLVVADSPAFLDVDVAFERCRYGCGKIAAGVLLGTLEEGKVSVGDINRLVRHEVIVSPGCGKRYRYEYTYIAMYVKRCRRFRRN